MALQLTYVQLALAASLNLHYPTPVPVREGGFLSAETHALLLPPEGLSCATTCTLFFILDQTGSICPRLLSLMQTGKYLAISSPPLSISLPQPSHGLVDYGCPTHIPTGIACGQPASVHAGWVLGLYTRPLIFVLVVSVPSWTPLLDCHVFPSTHRFASDVHVLH